ncbi:MAG: A/G-specific adenine glycosylase [Planctomycetaceae bacterium]|nr:A/G-specific adenine glycosylase [Planctomycetaceae bacterium]
MTDTLDDRFDFPALRRRLKSWYRKNGRELPWRNLDDPYRVWISEIMLQQTTVTTVIPYYERFFQRFPNVRALAAADQQEVLALWEGLGYYSRARNLHKAAGLIVEEHAGEFPTSAHELQKLPGIGRYTAGAIASFAMGQSAPIVEANTLRLYARLLGMRGDPRSTAGQRELWEFAEAVLPKRNAGDVNQALMDLGSLVCTPTEPDCPHCPLLNDCRAAELKLQHEIPKAKQKTKITALQDICVAVMDGRKVLLRQRQPDERWAGLWDFPRWTTENPLPTMSKNLLPPPSLEQSILAELHERTGYRVNQGPLAEVIKHSVTRYRIELFCFTAEKISGRKTKGEPLVWVSLDDLDDRPLSKTGRQFARTLQAGSLF